VARNSLIKRSTHNFQEHQRKIFRETSHLFAYLMLAQWVGGIIAALVITPRTWIGTTSTHAVVLFEGFLDDGVLLSGNLSKT